MNNIFDVLKKPLSVFRISDNVELPINTAVREAFNTIETPYWVHVIGYKCDLTKSHTKTCMQCNQICVEYVSYYIDDKDAFKCTECVPSKDIVWYNPPSARNWVVMDIDESQFNMKNIPDWPLIDLLHDKEQCERLMELMRKLLRELQYEHDKCADLAVGAFMHYAETHETHEGLPFDLADLAELARDVGFSKFVDTFVNQKVAKEPQDHWAVFLSFVYGRYDFMNKNELKLGYKYAVHVIQAGGLDKNIYLDYQTLGEMMDHWQQSCYSPEHTPEQQQARNKELLEMDAESMKQLNKPKAERVKMDYSQSKFPEYQRVRVPEGEIIWT